MFRYSYSLFYSVDVILQLHHLRGGCLVFRWYNVYEIVYIVYCEQVLIWLYCFSLSDLKSPPLKYVITSLILVTLPVTWVSCILLKFWFYADFFLISWTPCENLVISSFQSHDRDQVEVTLPNVLLKCVQRDIQWRNFFSCYHQNTWHKTVVITRVTMATHKKNMFHTALLQILTFKPYP